MFSKVIGDKMLVKMINEENKTASGIIITGKDKASCTRGEVVQLGSGITPDFEHIQVGHIVLFGKYAGDVIKLNGEEYLVLESKEILATMGKE